MLIQASQVNFPQLHNASDIRQLMENSCTSFEIYQFPTQLTYYFHNRLIPLFVCSVQRSNGFEEAIEIPDVMFNTDRLRQRSFYDDLLVSLGRQPLQQVDAAVSQGVCILLLTKTREIHVDV